MKLGLVVAHLIVIPGGILAFETGRVRFIGLYLYYLTFLTIFDVLFLLSDRSDFFQRTPRTGIDGTILDARTIVILLCVGMFVLVHVKQKLLFYAIIAGICFLILLRAWRSKHTGISVVLTMLTAFMLLASQVLTVAFFAPTGDTFTHVAFAQQVAEAGDVAAIPETNPYSDFPITHVFVATGIILFDISPRVAGFLLIGIALQGVLAVAFVFVRDWTESISMAVTAIVLLGTNYFYIRYGTSVHPQTLSFILYYIFLLLLFRSDVLSNKMFLVTPVCVAWIMTHMLSLAMAIVMLGAPMLALIGLQNPSEVRRRLAVFLIWTISLVGYWTIATSSISKPFAWILSNSPSAQGLSSSLDILKASSPSALVVSSIPHTISFLHYSVLLATVVLGGCYIYTHLLKRSHWVFVFIAGILPVVFYFPNPSWVLLRGIGELARWGLMALPFIVILSAAGFYSLDVSEANITDSLKLVFVLLFLLVSVSSGMADPSLTDALGFQKEKSHSVSHQEIAAVEFAALNVPENIQVSSNPHLGFYYKRFERQTATTGTLHVRPADGTILLPEGLVVFPTADFQQRAIRVLVRKQQTQGVWRTVSSRTASLPAHEANVVYNNSEAVVFKQ